MSPQLPAAFEDYNAILHLNSHPGNKASTSKEGGPEDDLNDMESSFNGLFQDIKEITKDGDVIAVMKTHSILKRSNENKGRFGEYSLLLRRIMDVNSAFKPTAQLEIQSEALRNAFAEIAYDLTTIRLSHDPIVIPEPYAELYYCRQRIVTYLQSTSNKTLRAELELLIEFQQNYMVDTVRTIEHFRRSGHIEFDWLWAIFPPGELVVIQNTSASASAIEWCAVVRAFEVQMLDGGARRWAITVIHMGFNGSRFGNVETSFFFPSFAHNMLICQLPVYPIHFCKNQTELLQNALRRGKAYQNYCSCSSRSKEKPIGTPMRHEGPIWVEREPGDEYRRGCRLIDSPSGVVSPIYSLQFDTGF